MNRFFPHQDGGPIGSPGDYGSEPGGGGCGVGCWIVALLFFLLVVWPIAGSLINLFVRTGHL